MMRLARWTAVLAAAAVLAACGGKSTSTSDGRLGTANYAFTAHDLLGNDFRGNYAWIHGYRSAVVDAKYPCLNEFTDCRALDQQGVTLAVEDLCPTVDTPTGTWTFEFYLSTDAECRQPMPNLVCAIVPSEELKRGANHNEVPCTTDNASKDFDFCIYDPNTGAGAGACENIPPPPGGSTISVLKFYDANLDGLRQASEPVIASWHVTLFGGPAAFAPRNAQTNTAGVAMFDGLAAGSYQACEVLPAGGGRWTSTTGTVRSATAGGTVSFGNVCLGGGGGFTPGYWQGPTGQGRLTGSLLCMLNGLNLVQANGAAFDPVAGCPTPTGAQVNAGKASLGTWFSGASATNMASMLSVHLAAMELNVGVGSASSTAVVAAPGTGLSAGGQAGYATIGDLMAAANASLAAHPSTPEGDAARPLQTALKNALDAANNDHAFVLPLGAGGAVPCEVVYTGSESSCIPAT